MRLVFDIETNGLLEELDTVHSLVIRDYDTGETFSCHNHGGEHDNVIPIAHGLKLLREADELIGHNIIRFDIPALKKVYPWFNPKARLIDTLVLSQLFYPNLFDDDTARVRKGTLPPKMRGRYSLEAFGYRLGEWKGDYSAIMKERGLDPWAEWSQEMQDYCVQDIVVNVKLYDRLLDIWYDRKSPKPRPHSDESVHLEMKVAEIIDRQEKWGFSFDVKAAEKFATALIQEREVLTKELTDTFGWWWAPDGAKVTPKKPRSVKMKDIDPASYRKKRDGTLEPVYVTCAFSPDAPYTKVKQVVFNPGSRHHIASRLKKLFDWEPLEFTPTGEPKIDDTILSQMGWPEARLLSKYFTVQKRLGQCLEGDKAWLRKERNGRIHGRVNTVRAVTRRMTHDDPNVAQVPKVVVDEDTHEVIWGYDGAYGAECRSLFTATAGYVLVGCDADALELRCLAGYMAAYDGGDYIRTVLSGKKSEGTDMHTVNARALGLDPIKVYQIDGRGVTGREIAKTWFYAFIYGAGDAKLGRILGSNTAAGKKSKENFMKNLPALGQLVTEVRKAVQKRGFLKTIDGGKLRVRKAHAALNTLLQSAGAIIMKKALVLLDESLQAHGLSPSRDYEFVANIHDEFQIDVIQEHVELVKKLAPESIKNAGEAFGFRCPLAGNADEGATWKDTH